MTLMIEFSQLNNSKSTFQNNLEGLIIASNDANKLN